MMLNRLHFVALPYPEESPRSLLIRTKEKNGFASVCAMANTLLPTPQARHLAWQLVETSFISELAKEAGEYAPQFLAAFYKRLPGVTLASPLKVMETAIPYDLFSPTKHRICPICSQEGWLRAIQDLNCIDVCPYHNCTYLNRCPACQLPLQWNSMGIGLCRCGFDLTCIKPISMDGTGSRAFLNYLRTQNSAAVRLIHEALRALRHEQAAHVEIRNKMLITATALAGGNIKALQSLLDDCICQRPGLPIRAHLAPWLTSSEVTLREHANTLLTKAPLRFFNDCRNCNCSEHGLYANEINYLLGTSHNTVRHLVEGGWLTQGRMQGQNKQLYPLDAICKLFRLLNSAPSNISNEQARPLLHRHGKDVHLVEKLNAISQGQLTVIKADARESLWHIQIIGTVTNTKPDQSATYARIAEAAQILDVYPDVVRRAIKSGILHRSLISNNNRGYLISRDELDIFHRDYVFVTSLAKILRTNCTTLSAKLMNTGIYPISGPGIDQGLVPLYRRTDLLKINLEQVAAMKHFKSRAGRKTGSPSLFDENEWLTSAKTAKRLGLPAQILVKLALFGLLDIGTPPGRETDLRRFFTIRSVEAAEKWMKTAVPLSAAARELGKTPEYLRRRFIRSGFIRPLQLTNTVLIDAAEIAHMRKHLELFCTCTEADRWLGAPARHFSNLVAGERIKPVSIEEAGGIDTVRLLHWEDVWSIQQAMPAKDK